MSDATTKTVNYTDQRYYATIWFEVLRNVLGWSERDSVGYVASQSASLLNEWLTHDTPAYGVCHLFVPDFAKERVGPNYRILVAQIERIIQSNLPVGWVGAPALWTGECDWKCIISECNVILDMYEYQVVDCQCDRGGSS